MPPPAAASVASLAVAALVAGVAAWRRRGVGAAGRGPEGRGGRDVGRTARRVRARLLNITREKTVTATKRLPMWKMSDEMYTNRQLVPDPNSSWTEIRSQQGRMKEMVLVQQKKDMRAFQRELSGWRLPPTHAIGDLRTGMWIDGRISRLCEFGVLVDCGVYTEMGEYYDGFMHAGQLREDGLYVEMDKMTNEVHLGELVRVRVRDVVPSAGILKFSLRTAEDLPELFMGKPRPYSDYDLMVGMKVKGIVRRAWKTWAIVDIGSNTLHRLHVREAKREITVYGFTRLGRTDKYAYAAYAVGAELDLWVREIACAANASVRLTCNKWFDPIKRLLPMSREQDMSAMVPGLQKEEKLTHGQRKDREKAAKETEPWKPYVAHVDEWLEDAAEPDPATDSWVAQQEKSLFEADQAEQDADLSLRGVRSYSRDDFGDGAAGGVDEDDFADEDFAEDEFGDEFGDTGAYKEDGGSSAGFGEFAFRSSELDGWTLNENGDDEEKKSSRKAVDWTDKRPPAPSEAELEAFFDQDDVMDSETGKY